MQAPGRRQEGLWTALVVLTVLLLVVGAASAASVTHRHPQPSFSLPGADASNEVRLTYCAVTDSDQGIARALVTNTQGKAQWFALSIEVDGATQEAALVTADVRLAAHRTETVTALGALYQSVLGPVTCQLDSARRTSSNFPVSVQIIH